MLERMEGLSDELKTVNTFEGEKARDEETAQEVFHFSPPLLSLLSYRQPPMPGPKSRSLLGHVELPA